MNENKPKTIIVHHTGVSSLNPQLQAVNTYHASLDFPLSTLDYFVGYHWFIERDGTTTQTRLDLEEGAHTLRGWNTKSIGICLAGNFDVEYPSNAQISSLRRLIDKYGYKVLLHREADPNRTCPGKNLHTSSFAISLKGEDDRAKCSGLEVKIKEQQTLIQQLLDFIVNKLR